MSERALFALALLLGGVASPVAAQEIERLRRHEAELERRLTSLQTEAATRDSQRFAAQARRVVTAGPLHVALPDWVGDEETRGLESLVAERRERFGAAVDSLLTDTLVIWSDTALRTGDGYAPLEWRLGALSSKSSIPVEGADDIDWVRWIAATALDRWARSLLDPRFSGWVGSMGASISSAELRDGSVRDLILSPSARGRRCADGAVGECRLLLELDGDASARLDAYDPSDLLGIVERTWAGRQRAGRAPCVTGRNPTACRAYLERARIVPSAPAPGRVRQSLFAFAIEKGGDGAWLRLGNASGRSVAEQLAAVSGMSPDELLGAWQRDLRAQRRTTDAGLVPNLLLALGWLVVGTLIFAWRYQWRRV